MRCVSARRPVAGGGALAPRERPHFSVERLGSVVSGRTIGLAPVSIPSRLARPVAFRQLVASPATSRTDGIGNETTLRF